MFGLLTMVLSLTMVPPVFVGWWYGDGDTSPFAIAFLVLLVTGLVCWLPVRHHPLDLRNRDAFLVVTLFWVAICVLGAVPLVFSHHPHMRLVDAVFESVSGLTTTGATVLSGLDRLPHSILYYRGQLNFLGGMGIVVLAVALLPMLGIGGMQIYRAETPGPMKEDKLTPRITETARRLWYVYVGLVAACSAAFWAAGMSLFDAINHSFATVSLGGFSTHDDNIGFFQSPAVEVVAGVFTVLAGVNFALHFLAWRGWDARVYVRDPELRLYLWVMGLLVVLSSATLYLKGTFSVGAALYHGFFQATSIAADNGLVTAGYPHDWPVFVVLLLLLGSFFGGCAGSTCGGIKAIRFLLLYKQSMRELRLLNHPTACIAIKLGPRAVGERVVTAVWAFYFLYILAYCAVSLALVATGLDLVTAFGSVAGCLNNMGVGLGQTAVNFGPINDAAKWLLSFAMLIGRLEVFPILLLFLPDFWRR